MLREWSRETQIPVMATWKCHAEVQTGSDVVQKSDSTAQTGTIYHQATSSTQRRKYVRDDQAKIITPLVVQISTDNFDWYEEGRATQTSPTLERSPRSTQTPTSKNSRKMMRAKSTNRRIKAQNRRLIDEPKCQGNTHIHTQTYSDKTKRVKPNPICFLFVEFFPGN